MTQPNRKKRQFCGMSYRDVQRSNTNRRKRLPQQDQTWLKENGYRNVGWDQVIRLYQKINDILERGDDDEPSLEDLFLQADRIGNKYQTQAEQNEFNQQLAAEAGAIAELVDQQFPDTEVEQIDFGGNLNGRSRLKASSKKRKRR